MVTSRWENLPEDVVERILHKLPISSILCARAVSRSWKAKAGQLSLWRLYDLNCTTEKHWLVALLTRDSLGFNMSLDRWYRVPLHLPDCIVRHGVGGLLLLSHFHEQFVVGNPISNAWKQLPPLPIRHGFAQCVAMAKGADANSYKVVVLVGDPKCESFTPMVYDSKLGVWFVKKLCKLCMDVWLPALTPLVAWNGAFCAVGGKGMLKYDVEMDELTHVDQIPPGELYMPHLVPWKGNMYMFTRLRDMDMEQFMPIGVCVLHTDKWTLLSKSPLRVGTYDFAVWLDGDIVNLFVSGSSSMLTYNLAVADLWSTIQIGCPRPRLFERYTSVCMPLSFTAAP